MDFPLVIFCTASSNEEAVLISETLIRNKLAACVNRVSGVQSMYFWKNTLCDEQEWLLIIKSKKSLLEPIIACIQKVHSYEVPEIIALPIMGGSEGYLHWLEEQTQ